ncbi:hypothetical protein Leryth_004663 [Lithospermum erythrorhizon]|nr:hypothetical protein Leryth_004663 [Lithospermum erythrorhizon]
MNMSLFSSFDVLCAESFGKKVSLSWGSAKEDKNQQLVKDSTNKSVPSASVDHLNDKKAKDGMSSSSSSSSNEKIAVELDGVHCFETIIPY